MSFEIPEFEVGDLVSCRVVGEEQEGYTVNLVNHESVSGYYPCRSNISKGTRIETCFVCLDGDRVLLAPKSFLKQRQQLTLDSSDRQSPEFSPQNKIIPPDNKAEEKGNFIDFSPPSDFNSEFITLIANWQLISSIKEKELKDKVSGGSWELVGLLKRLDIFTPQELTSLDFGRSLLKREKISWTDFKKPFLTRSVLELFWKILN